MTDTKLDAALATWGDAEVTLHYLNPDNEYRDCPGCNGCKEWLSNPSDCNGTGKLGDKDAKPEIEVIEWRSGVRTMYSWNAAISGFEDDTLYPTEAKALAAARKELK